MSVSNFCEEKYDKSMFNPIQTGGEWGRKVPTLTLNVNNFFKIQPNAANFTSFSKIYLGLNWDRLFFLELDVTMATSF